MGHSFGLVQLLKHAIHILGGKDHSPGAAAIFIGIGDKHIFKVVEPIDKAADGIIVLKAVDAVDF